MGSNKIHSIQRLVVICGFIILTAACQPKEKMVSENYSCSNRASTTYSGQPESAVCTSTKSYAGGVTITAHAEYEYRAYDNTSLSSTISTNEIRHAEFRVYKGGTLVQCGDTSDDGTFTFAAPNDPTGNYTLKVYSRGDNSAVKASVLNCPEENEPYVASLTFSPSGNIDIGTVTADAANSGDMVGAAFNIFDQIVSANILLKDELSDCSSTYTGCKDFSVAPKVQAYWVKGFNPNNYFGSTSGVSFYIPGHKRLFILGGINGDIFTSDTDHFDNSVILHEYGHFLEDVYTETDSPGGSHFGNGLIDPRLAWSEGWGNFFQAAVLGGTNPRYRDSIGTPGSSTSDVSYAFNILIETYQKQYGGGAPTNCVAGTELSGCDLPVYPSEGVFREFAITRYLWDIFDSTQDTDGDPIDGGLKEIWAAITKTDNGFLNPKAEFRNIGLLNLFEGMLNMAPNWSTLQGTTYGHRMPANTEEYGQYVTAGGSCTYSMIPLHDPDDSGTLLDSHRLRNNNFHHFYNPSRRTVKITINVTTIGGAGSQEPDVDLFLYNVKGRYGNGNDIVGALQGYWDNNPLTVQTETLVVSNLPAGHYLINPKVYTGTVTTNQCFGACPGATPDCICQGDKVPAGDEIEYELIIEAGNNPGVNLCPDDYP